MAKAFGNHAKTGVNYSSSFTTIPGADHTKMGGKKAPSGAAGKGKSIPVVKKAVRKTGKVT